jgi:hypothetical protein
MKRIIPLMLIASITLFTCSKDEDPCEAITCLNGGECANGLCKCSERYKGPDCSQQVTPSKIKITKITVTGFPATESNGAGWDLTDGADIFPFLFVGNTVIYDSPVLQPNANPSIDYDFTPTSPIEINPTTTYTLSLYDYDDTSADDFMGGVVFTPYESSNGFPEVLDLAPVGGSVTFKLHISYIF